MQYKQTVLLCEIVQINAQRSLPTLSSRTQSISVGYGKTGHWALSLLWAVQAQLCWDCKTLEIPQQQEDGDTAPGSSNQALTPVLKRPQTKKITFPFWQRFWPLILMAFDMQRIRIAGKMLQERKEVSGFIS